MIDGKSFEEKKEKSSEILWQSIEIFDKEKIKELYDKGLIVIDSLIDFGGIDICISLFVNGKLKPIDAKRLYENNTITQSMIEDILSDVNIKNTHKIVLIYSTFSENKYDEFRKELVLKYLSNFSEISQKDFLEEYIDKEKCDIFEGKNKGVISSCSKWNLISKIDLEYSQELLEDNHIIFYLPNEKKYIIDRLYDSNDNPVYGNATFIIKENIFKENKNLIIKENKINKNGLVILSKNIKKIVNTGWRNAIIKYFNIDDSEVYTEEQIKTIKLLAQEVENSKKSVMI